MSISQRSSFFLLVLSFAFLASLVHAVATPEQLDARLLELNEKVFSINSAFLTEEQKLHLDGTKRLLADAQLNLRFGNYDIVEELLGNAENELNLISEEKKSASAKFWSRPFALIIAVVFVALTLLAVVLLFVSKAKQPQIKIDIPKPSQVMGEKCPVCNGRIYKNVCVWCSFEYYNEKKS